MAEQTGGISFGGLIDALRKWWNASETESTDAGRAVAEEIDKSLPDSVGGYRAVQLNRKRLKDMDDMLAAAED